MVNFTENELRIIDHFKRFTPKTGVNAPSKYEQYLNQIPMEGKNYKCYTCFSIIPSSDLIDGKCPECGETKVREMCTLDHNHCQHNIVDRIEFCPVCGEALCPECGCHDVAPISRVTGYLSNVQGWHAGKQQELKDRVRVELQSNGEMISKAIKH